MRIRAAVPLSITSAADLKGAGVPAVRNSKFGSFPPAPKELSIRWQRATIDEIRREERIQKEKRAKLLRNRKKRK